MGLSLNYRLRARKDIPAAEILVLVAAMRDQALEKFKADADVKVTDISGDAAELFFWHHEWIRMSVPGEGNAFRGIEVPAIERQVFAVYFGESCEPMRLGLCHYP